MSESIRLVSHGARFRCFRLVCISAFRVNQNRFYNDWFINRCGCGQNTDLNSGTYRTLRCLARIGRERNVHE